MSLIQSIIGSSVGQAAPPGPTWNYPPSGNNYPVNYGNAVSASSGGVVSGYYEEISLAGPTLGLWRRTFNGQAIAPNGNEMWFTQGFPAAAAVEEFADTHVGFGNDTDVATNFSVILTGYFKPAVTGDFVFSMFVDDYASMWIGANARAGSFAVNNVAINANNNRVDSLAYTMTAGKYYPVRIMYTEISGGHNLTIWSGLNNTVLQNQDNSAATGQFYFDGNNSNGGYLGEFASIGLIV